MKILIALPTKSTKDPLILEAANYLKRLRPPTVAQTVLLNPKSALENEEHRKDIEGVELLKKTEGYFRIALTEGGKQYDSKDFARLVERHKQQNPKLAFLIGGAYGLSHNVILACQATLSLSLMTMPHRMAYLVLAEQLYRACEIANGHPYHK